MATSGLAVIDRLKRYLPEFINTTSEIPAALLFTVGNVISDLYNKILSFKDFYYTEPFIKLQLDDWHVHANGNELQSAKQALLSDLFTLHQERGTEGVSYGVVSDIKQVSGDSAAVVTLYDETDTGWWLGHTFPDISPGFTFLDIGKVALIDFDNLSKYYTRQEIKYIIQHEILPYNFTALYIEPTPDIDSIIMSDDIFITG